MLYTCSQHGLLAGQLSHAAPRAARAAVYPLVEGCSPEECPRPPAGFHCEFDGKLSLARFRDTLLLFSRANPRRDGGARHVQVTELSDGWETGGRFKQARDEPV